MKILTIGDVHGEDIIWRLADLKILREFPEIETDFDYYIFLGDYVDSHKVPADKIFKNLEGIIQLKRNYSDKVILLLGNHELPYLFGYDAFPCSGYNPSWAHKISSLLIENQDIFQPIFYINELLFSHAGISNKWLKTFNEQYKITDGLLHPNAISEAYFQATIPKGLNPYSAVFDVGKSRGGQFEVGGPFWADFSETIFDSVPGWHQIVGHTLVSKIRLKQIDRSNIEMGSITYINTISATEVVKEIAYALEV